MNVYLVKAASAFAAAFSIAIGAGLCAVGMGRIGASALDGTSRQPEMAGKLFTTMLIAFALVEALAIYCLLISIILLTANPLLK